MEIGFSLGTNLGNRQAHMSEARRRISAFPDTAEVAASSLYDTQPVGVKDEYREMNFLNAVLIVETEATCEAWLKRLGRIETDMGRVRGEDRNAPRPIDIDILYAGDALIDSGGLQVPHPRWAERRFVVAPLAEVRPDLSLPGAGRPVKDVLAELPEEEGVEVLGDPW